MWDKVPFRSRRPTIGTPALVDKTLDDSVYKSMSPAPGSRDGQYAKELPALPFEHTDPSSRPPQVVSPQNLDEQLRQRSSSLTPRGQSGFNTFDSIDSWHRSPEISPPDTPRSLSRQGASRGSSQISPIEDEPRQRPGSEPMETKFTSHLPKLRNKGARKDSIPSRSSDARNTYKLSSGRPRETRWDDFSGEPTMDTSGKAAQATPGQAPRPQSTSKPTGSHPGILGWGKEQFHPKKKFAEARSRLSRNDNMMPSAAREPWKGPSGRSPIVNPIQEKPRGRSPLHAQPSNLSKTNDWLRETNASPDLTTRGIVPTVVTTISAGAPSATATGPEKRTANNSKSASPHRPKDHPPAQPLPTLSLNNSAPPRVDLPAPDLSDTLADLKLTSEDQPGSRFSATTYSPTEETASSTGSRRESIDFSTLSTDNLPSIMSRKRPVPSIAMPGKMPVKMPVRKPTPSQAAQAAQASQASEGQDGAPKDPTHCPPEQTAESRLQALEARKDTLARRRGNINTIIHELTQVIQPSSVAYDLAAREEVKKTVASLENELAEIRREEHELGVKLLRAWKKRDEQDAYGGGTGLWVKRVTS